MGLIILEKKINIAIDGPASAGKSTLAQLLAQELSYIYCDTGAMYRAVTYALINNINGLLNSNISDIKHSDISDLLSTLCIQFQQSNGQQTILLNGQDITEEIRSSEVTELVSVVAARADVREFLLKQQQAIAKDGGVVMDGRDIGTVVLPHAEVKFFLIASVQERAKRRYLELKRKGEEVQLQDIEASIAKRDFLDQTRSIAPLKKAEDAIELDTTGKTISEVQKEMMMIVRTYLTK